jgi:hypothetical protein
VCSCSSRSSRALVSAELSGVIEFLIDSPMRWTTEPCVLSGYVSAVLRNDRYVRDRLRDSLVVSIADTPHGCAIVSATRVGIGLVGFFLDLRVTSLLEDRLLDTLYLQCHRGLTSPLSRDLDLAWRLALCNVSVVSSAAVSLRGSAFSRCACRAEVAECASMAA